MMNPTIGLKYFVIANDGSVAYNARCLPCLAVRYPNGEIAIVARMTDIISVEEHAKNLCDGANEAIAKSQRSATQTTDK